LLIEDYYRLYLPRFLLGCLPKMSDTPPQTLSSFTLFPNLPFELRCLIWETTCQSRLVEVDYDSCDGFSSNIAPPIALEVCRESRNAVINNYPLCFGSIFHPANIRFNFAIDTLYIDNSVEDDISHLFSTFREREISSLRYLAIDACFGNPEEEHEFRGVKRAVKALEGLRELLIVFHVDALSRRIMGCGGEHDLELFDELPEEISKPVFEIPPLSGLPFEDFHDWELGERCRPIYGWRRCPDNDDIIEPNPRGYFNQFDSDDEESDMEWAGWPIGQGMGMGMFLPGDFDSEIDDEEDDEENESDMDLDTDSEMPGLASESDDSENISEAASLD